MYKQSRRMGIMRKKENIRYVQYRETLDIIALVHLYDRHIAH